MIVKQLKTEEFNQFARQLVEKAQQDPVDACFHVTVKVNQREYILRIQPEQEDRVAVLQALAVERDPERGQTHWLVTNNKLLSSLLELLLWQGI